MGFLFGKKKNEQPVQQYGQQQAYQQQYAQPYQQPVQQQYTQSPQQTYQQPVQQQYAQQQAYGQPVQPQYTQSLQQTYQQPVRQQYAQQQAYGQPVQPQYTQPQQQAYEQPVQQPAPAPEAPQPAAPRVPLQGDEYTSVHTIGETDYLVLNSQDRLNPAYLEFLQSTGGTGQQHDPDGYIADRKRRAAEEARMKEEMAVEPLRKEDSTNGSTW